MSRAFTVLHGQLYDKVVSKFSVEAENIPIHAEGDIITNVNYVFKSEPEQQNGKADKPSIGIFLGTVKNSADVRQFQPMEYTYIITVLQTFDVDIYDSYGTAMGNMYELLIDVIDYIGYEVVTPIETLTTISNDEGTFTTGYIAQIAINASLTQI